LSVGGLRRLRFVAMRADDESRLEFQKRSQLFIRVHNEALSVAAMCVNNPDCSPFAIQR
jgi:hypothetical protein